METTTDIPAQTTPQNGPESEDVDGSSEEGEEGLCVEGCLCPANTLLWKGACVPKQSCPCFHKVPKPYISQS